MNTILTGEQILDYIPQRPPIVMIDSLFQVTEESTKTGLTIKEDNFLLKNGKLSSMGLIENIAQTAAISAGYYFKSRNESLRIGFIGSVKKLAISHWPAIGDQIITEIKEIQEVMNVKIIEGTVTLNQKKIACCELKIFFIDERGQ